MQNVFQRRIGQYTIRQCVPDDLKEVISINWLSLPEHYTNFFFEELLRDSPETFLVAERNNQIVGYIMCRIEYGFSHARRLGLARKGHIVSVAILEGNRRQGLGSALVTTALEAMKTRGCSEAYLEVRTSNLVAVKLYENLRFKIASKLSAYYRDSEDAYLMIITLRS